MLCSLDGAILLFLASDVFPFFAPISFQPPNSLSLSHYTASLFSPSPLPLPSESSPLCISVKPPSPYFPTALHLWHAPYSISPTFHLFPSVWPPIPLPPPSSSMLVKISADSRSSGTPDSLSLSLFLSTAHSLSQTSHPCDLCSSPLCSSHAFAFQLAAANESLCEREKEKER